MRALISAILIALSAAVAGGDVVERRGTGQVLEGRIVRVNDAGVTITSSLGATQVISWDRVRRIEPQPHDPKLQERATELWRARSRVERNDTALAEPLLERLFEVYRGQTHETALVVAEGLLRCRLARGDHALAVVPALELTRLRRASVTTDSYTTLRPIIDPAYALCTVLAPAWASPHRLESLAHDLETYDAQGDRVVAALAAVYRQAAVSQLEGSADARPRALPDHDGVQLLAMLVDAGGDDSAAGRAARQRLVKSFGDLPDWAEAWGRYQLGVAMLRERSLEDRQRGAVNLIHLPARFARTQPYLAGLALMRVAELLEQTGDVEAATELRSQLRERHLHLLDEIEGDE